MIRRAAVLGKPIGHSLSPLIHSAGYAAAGLDTWHYTAHECDEQALAAFVAGLDEEWVGLSLTMPLKEVVLSVADTVDARAVAIGAANTLVRQGHRWHAANTDAPGLVRALQAAGVGGVRRVAVLGAGGTARAALGAAAMMAAPTTVYARRPEAVAALLPAAAALGVALTSESWCEVHGDLEADVVISTVPRGVADTLPPLRWHPGVTLFDVVYDPWPTPIAMAAAAGGARVVSGLDLLLAQAVDQFELFTGVQAPVEAMRLALTRATGQPLHSHTMA